MMSRWRLRSKFLLWMLVISAAVTSTTLFLVRRAVEHHLREQILHDLHNSVSTFRNVQHQRQDTLQHTAQLVANLPISRALMTTKDRTTIQDGSGDLWRLAGTDLLVMADRSGNVLGLRSNTGALDAATASESLRRMSSGAESWWFGRGHLYEISVQPIYFGTSSEERIMGFLVVGTDVDERVAEELSQVTGIEVAFCYGDDLIRSTLPSDETTDLVRIMPGSRVSSREEPADIRLGGEPFLVASVALEGESARPVRLMVLKSLTEANDFVRRLDRLLLGLGLVAVVAGSVVVSLVSRAFTKPLDRLVTGVRALGAGDYDFLLPVEGQDEVAELTSAFSRMRSSLRDSQRELLQSERLATIGRMASSISHDLRHHLVAILANAEFLIDDRSRDERQELYDELRLGVSQMTDLIDSLLELSRPREALRRTKVALDELLQRVVQSVRAYTRFCNIEIEVHGDQVDGRFDSAKLHRVFQNLLVNACEAVPVLGGGRVDILLTVHDQNVEIRVRDNGRGIPAELHDRIFDTFVSYGKENGTGLGLTIVRKLVEDHGGTAAVESSSVTGTVMLIRLPLLPAADAPAIPIDNNEAKAPFESSN